MKLGEVGPNGGSKVTLIGTVLVVNGRLTVVDVNCVYWIGRNKRTEGVVVLEV